MKFFDQAQSEDLPHVSGIKTISAIAIKQNLMSRKTCPTYRGLRLKALCLPLLHCVGRLAPRIGD